MGRIVGDMDRAEAMRQRIDLYRQYLREGVSAELAAVYLREIAAAEAELKAIDSQGRPPPDARK